MRRLVSSMSVPSDIRPIVKKLLAGEKNVTHLNRLFLWLRQRTGGTAPAVKDIGDFAAHKDERDKGMMWERGKGFCFLTAKRMGFLPHTPEALSKALLGTLHLIGRNDIKQMTGRPYKEIERDLKRAIDKIATFDGKEITVKDAFTTAEDAAFNFFFHMRGYKNPFTQDVLSEELAACLLKEGIIDPSEKQQIIKNSEFVAIYAIVQMHLSKIIVDRSHLATLKACTSSNRPGMLVVHVHYSIDGRSTYVAELFTTHCQAQEWCVQTLVPVRIGPFEGIPNWDVPLDINNDGKLAPLV